MLRVSTHYLEEKGIKWAKSGSARRQWGGGGSAHIYTWPPLRMAHLHARRTNQETQFVSILRYLV